MRTQLLFILVGLCAAPSAAVAQPIEKVPARDAWLYAHNGFQLPRRVPKENFDRVHYGMTLEEMVKLLGKGWMRPNSSIREIYWGCVDGRIIRINPSTLRKDEKVIKGMGDELAAGATMQMYRVKDRKIEDIPVPIKGGEKKDRKSDPVPESQ